MERATFSLSKWVGIAGLARHNIWEGLPDLREARAKVSYCSSSSGANLPQNLPQDPLLDNIDKLKSYTSKDGC
jgi:hypothetical protein